MKKPTTAYVSDQLSKLEKQYGYNDADPAVRLVFERWPENREHAQVLAKASVLNALFLTRILSVYPVVERVLSLKIDDRLRAGDETLVGDLAKVKLGKKRKTLLSFASKYCAFHQPERFQIFDRRVERALWAYRKEFHFADFPRWKLRDYPTFMHVMEEFRRFFGLTKFSRKEIDKFLWIEGGK